MLVSVSEVRRQLEAMPVFRHVAREFHLRHVKYRRHYTKERSQTFSFESEVTALHRMHGASCFLCDGTDGIPLTQIIAAPFEEHLCLHCRATLTQIVARHTSHTDRLRAIGRLPMLRELTQLCAELERASRYEHVRIAPDIARRSTEVALWGANPKRGPRSRGAGETNYRYDETGVAARGDEPPEG